MKRIILCAGLIGTVLYSEQAVATTFNEAGDAGLLVGSAQDIGVLTGSDNILGGIGFDSDIDLYRFTWTGGVLTITTTGTTGSLDPQLHLFDGAGAGIGENDDSAANPPQSQISLDLAAGDYHIGISTSDNDALNSDNDPVFDFTNPFDDLNGNSISSPVANNVLTGWNNFDAGTGSYDIQLAPEPSSFALLALGFGGLAAFRRRKRPRAA